MAAFAFLIIGLVCALVSRVLLFIAALNIGAGWAVGVLLPFGPVLFRLNYPEEARSSRMFRLATLPCFFLYIMLGPGPAYQHYIHRVTNISPQTLGYGSEKRKASGGQGPVVQTAPTIEERRASNAQEFEHLRVWGEALRLKKRDLLHSDTAGNVAYAAELAQYNATLEKAKAERLAIWPSTK